MIEQMRLPGLPLLLCTVPSLFSKKLWSGFRMEDAKITQVSNRGKTVNYRIEYKNGNTALLDVYPPYAAFVPPQLAEGLPGYYLIAGYSNPKGYDRDGDSVGNAPIFILAEGQYDGTDLTKLFDRLTDDFLWLAGDEIFYSDAADQASFLEAFLTYLDKARLHQIGIAPAPWSDRPEVGISKIYELLRFHQLNLRTQSNRLLRDLENFEASQIRDIHKYPTINCLRLLASALVKYRPVWLPAGLQDGGPIYGERGWMAN